MLKTFDVKVDTSFIFNKVADLVIDDEELDMVLEALPEENHESIRSWFAQSPPRTECPPVMHTYSVTLNVKP